DFLSKGTAIAHIAGAVSVCAPIDRTTGNGIMLVGDAARQIDPMTGGGITNGCVAARIAGNVAAEAVSAKDYSAEFFSAYEKGWRAEFEDKSYMNWMAKEKLSNLSDETLNKLIDAISDVKVEKIRVYELLQAVKVKYPELVKEFEEFIM
ncbi:MAG: NAD(P)/FAD-dependent oxidoreductase, partial [Thermoplasmata archaeon]